MITLGITGGIASGKSEVARYLGEKGCPVVDVDRVAHETYAIGTRGHAEVVAAFGPGVLGADGSIDRRVLGSMVFGSPEAMKRLTDIVWPLTRDLLKGRIQSAALTGTRALVVEAALMYEAGWDDLMDVMWIVRTSRESALRRLMARNRLSEVDALARIESREELDVSKADLVIDNDGDLESLHGAVETAWLTLTSSAR
jgi:dephospho-CoA kinase